MTPAEQASLHVVLLQHLRTKRDLGRPEDALLNDARMAGGFTLTLPGLQTELQTMGDRNWIAPMNLDIGLRRWRITALGESKLTEAGL